MPPEFYSMFENYTISYLLQTSKNQVLNHMRIFQCLCCSRESVKSPCVIFHNMPVYLGKGLSASHKIPKLKDDPLSAVCDSLFDIFTVTLHVQRLSIPPTNSEQILGDTAPNLHGKFLLTSNNTYPQSLQLNQSTTCLAHAQILLTLNQLVKGCVVTNMKQVSKWFFQLLSV